MWFFDLAQVDVVKWLRESVKRGVTLITLTNYDLQSRHHQHNPLTSAKPQRLLQNYLICHFIYLLVKGHKSREKCLNASPKGQHHRLPRSVEVQLVHRNQTARVDSPTSTQTDR